MSLEDRTFPDPTDADTVLIIGGLAINGILLILSALMWKNRDYPPIKVRNPAATGISVVGGVLWFLALLPVNGHIPFRSWLPLQWCSVVTFILNLTLGYSVFLAGLIYHTNVMYSVFSRGAPPKRAITITYLAVMSPAIVTTSLATIFDATLYDETLGECFIPNEFFLLLLLLTFTVMGGMLLYANYSIVSLREDMRDERFYIHTVSVVWVLAIMILFATISSEFYLTVIGRLINTYICIFIVTLFFFARMARPLYHVYFDRDVYLHAFTEEFMGQGLGIDTYLSALAGDHLLAGAVEALNQPIFNAVITGNLEELKRVANTYGDPRAPDPLGRTPLHHAAQHGQFEIIVWLIEEQAVGDMAIDSQGNTVLHYAAEQGSIQIIEWLLTNRRGGSPTAVNKDGDTFLHVAIQEAHSQLIRPIFEHLGPTSSQLLSISNKLGETPFHVAAITGGVSIAQLLLVFGADSSTTNKVGRNALHTAAYYGHDPFARWLVKDLHFEVDSRDNNKRTPLHIAAGRGYRSICEYLIRHGADVNAVDSSGGTPLSKARCSLGSLATRDDIVMRLDPLQGTRDYLASQGGTVTVSGYTIAAFLIAIASALIVQAQAFFLPFSIRGIAWADPASAWYPLYSLHIYSLVDPSALFGTSPSVTFKLAAAALLGLTSVMLVAAFVKSKLSRRLANGVAGIGAWALLFPLFIPLSRVIITLADCSENSILRVSEPDLTCWRNRHTSYLGLGILMFVPLLAIVARLARVEGLFKFMHRHSFWSWSFDRLIITPRRLHPLQTDIRSQDMNVVLLFLRFGAIASVVLFTGAAAAAALIIIQVATLLVGMLYPRYSKVAPNAINNGLSGAAVFVSICALIVASAEDPETALPFGLFTVLAPCVIGFSGVLYLGVRHWRQRLGFDAELSESVTVSIYSRTDSSGTPSENNSITGLFWGKRRSKTRANRVSNSSTRAASGSREDIRAKHATFEETPTDAAKFAAQPSGTVGLKHWSLASGGSADASFPAYRVPTGHADETRRFDSMELQEAAPPSVNRMSRNAKSTSLRLLRLGTTPIPEATSKTGALTFVQIEDFAMTYAAHQPHRIRSGVMPAFPLFAGLNAPPPKGMPPPLPPPSPRGSTTAAPNIPAPPVPPSDAGSSVETPPNSPPESRAQEMTQSVAAVQGGVAPGGAAPAQLAQAPQQPYTPAAPSASGTSKSSKSRRKKKAVSTTSITSEYSSGGVYDVPDNISTTLSQRKLTRRPSAATISSTKPNKGRAGGARGTSAARSTKSGAPRPAWIPPPPRRAPSPGRVAAVDDHHAAVAAVLAGTAPPRPSLMDMHLNEQLARAMGEHGADAVSVQTARTTGSVPTPAPPANTSAAAVAAAVAAGAKPRPSLHEQHLTAQLQSALVQHGADSVSVAAVSAGSGSGSGSGGSANAVPIGSTPSVGPTPSIGAGSASGMPVPIGRRPSAHEIHLKGQLQKAMGEHGTPVGHPGIGAVPIGRRPSQVSMMAAGPMAPTSPAMSHAGVSQVSSATRPADLMSNMTSLGAGSVSGVSNASRPSVVSMKVGGRKLPAGIPAPPARDPNYDRNAATGTEAPSKRDTLTDDIGYAASNEGTWGRSTDRSPTKVPSFDAIGKALAAVNGPPKAAKNPRDSTISEVSLKSDSSISSANMATPAPAVPDALDPRAAAGEIPPAPPSSSPPPERGVSMIALKPPRLRPQSGISSESDISDAPPPPPS